MDFLTPLFSQLNSMAVGFVKLLPMIGIAFVVVLITWIVSKIVQSAVRNILNKAHMRPSLKSLFLSLIKIGVWTVGTLIALTIIFPSLTPAKILAALGLGSIAIGFAFQDIFENFLAGVMIMLREPMRIGDYIECGEVEGRIEKINIRDTFVRQTDDQLILVPNSILFKNEVFVRTDKEFRRFSIVCGVSYDTDLAEAKAVIQKAMESIDIIEQDKPIQIFAREFNSSSVDFTVRWWAKSKPVDMHESRDAVVMTIKKALDDAEIEIPFPYRTLTFKEQLQIKGAGTEEKSSEKEAA